MWRKFARISSRRLKCEKLVHQILLFDIKSEKLVGQNSTSDLKM